jgi:hypothetical protein
LDALVLAMPSSICRLEDDGEGRFLRCLLCLSACKEAFAGCLAFISFDACSIKNDFKGLFLQLVLWMETEKLCHLHLLWLQLKMPKQLDRHYERQISLSVDCFDYKKDHVSLF